MTATDLLCVHVSTCVWPGARFCDDSITVMPGCCMYLYYVLCLVPNLLPHFSGTGSLPPFRWVQTFRLASTCGIGATLVALNFLSSTMLGTGPRGLCFNNICLYGMHRWRLLSSILQGKERQGYLIRLCYPSTWSPTTPRTDSINRGCPC